MLFLDEVHRFNKAQQDTFLPYVEDGTLTFIGATTENPSFEVISALLSRARVYVLRSLEIDDIVKLLRRALEEPSAAWARASCASPTRRWWRWRMPATVTRAARWACSRWPRTWRSADTITVDVVREVAAGGVRRFDKGGEQFYDQISALHKAVRGTDPDAALYWFARMLDGGCDPHYLARRILRMAIEDIGLADPRGQQIALDAWQVYERLGSPEGELAIANALVYLAVAPKSNAAYVAYGEARADVEQFGTLDVPLRFRNAPTRLMKELGYGEGYRYAHDEPDAYREGRALFSRRNAGPALLPARVARSRDQDRRGARASCAPSRPRRSHELAAGGARWRARQRAAPWRYRLWPSTPGGWPVPTLTVNVLGCFAIGLIYMYVAGRGASADNARLFWMTGVLGGFTTYSAFALETALLGFSLTGVAYVLVTAGRLPRGRDCSA